LSDRAEPGDVHRDHRGRGQFSRRPAVRRLGSPDQILELRGTLMSIEYDVQLASARPRLRRPAGRLRLFFYRHPLGAIGALIMALFVFAAVFAPLITFYDPLTTDPAVSLARPGAAHWLGCDFMGRDVYSRIVYGARISLAVGCGSLVLGGRHGAVVGLLS